MFIQWIKKYVCLVMAAILDGGQDYWIKVCNGTIQWSPHYGLKGGFLNECFVIIDIIAIIPQKWQNITNFTEKPGSHIK
jgi:hypothetical protein